MDSNGHYGCPSYLDVVEEIVGILDNVEAAWEDSDLELQIQNPHIKVCKTCDPNLNCQLAKGFCPYRDLDV